MAGENELSIKINGNAKKFLDEIDKIKKKTADVEKVLSKTAKVSALAFAGFAAAIAGVTKEFATYEKALVGVGKTTNIEGKRLENFGKEFQKLSKEIPISTNELLGIAQAAGQLGVAGEKDLLLFTKTVAKLGVATNLSGEQAAISLTRILNVTGEAVSEIDRLGSVIVRLGNNVAASESEIAKITTEVAKATTVFKIGSTNAAGISAALAELGQQAQLGGSVVGRTFREIERILQTGGKEFENLEKITGLTGDQLKETFEKDATQVFTAFLGGLQKVEQGNGSVSQTLETLGLKGDEINKVLPALSSNFDRYTRSLALANDEAITQNALNEEAARAFNTLQSEYQKTVNVVTTLAVQIGEELAPTVIELLKDTRRLVDGLSNLDGNTVKVIASFLKWGAIISGVVAGVAAFGLGVIKASALIGALSATFLPATVAASGFWVAVTGPIGLAVLGVAAVTAGVVALSNALEETSPKSLDQINNELDKLNKALEKNKKFAQDVGKDPNQSVAVQQIQEKIDKLEELRQAQLRASGDFGTGSLLLRTEADNSGIDLTGGLQEQAIPLRPELEGGDEAAQKQIEKTREIEDAKNSIITEAVQKRIDRARAENEALTQLGNLRREGATEAELAFAQQRIEIDQAIVEAKKISNEEERALALQNLQLKNEELAAEEDEFEARRREEKAALQAELRELDLENQKELNDEDLAVLSESIDTKAEAEKKFRTNQIKADIQEKNLRKQEELKYGKEVAGLKAFFRKDEVKGVQNATSQLAQLQNSRNSTLKGIGKAAARVQAAISTAQGAIGAYASLAPIPIVGPALGVAAAASLVAYGVEQQTRISAAAGGGRVPQSIGGGRDRTPMFLEPNELIVPSALAPSFIQAAGIPDSQSDRAVGAEEENGTSRIEIMLEDRAGEFITLEQREGRALGLIKG